MWFVEFDPATQILTLRLRAQVSAGHMRQIMRAHAQALASTGGLTFGVLADLRGLAPLDREAANLFTDVKRAGSAMPTFQRRAVLVDSPTIALQQKRTSMESDDVAREIITSDEAEAMTFLGSTLSP
jgi:hypothetical protein